MRYKWKYLLVGDVILKFIIFRGKKLPMGLARKLLTIASYVVPLNKFYRDLYLALATQDKK
jgi:hypothetical protein